MKKYKVALIHNIISPYRVPLFEGLAKHPSIDLSVYFCAKTHKERKWDILDSITYNYEILSGITLEFSSIIYHINPSVISKLIQGKYDAVIIGGSADFTTQTAFVTSKLLKTPVILWSEGIESAQSFLGKLINPLTKYIVRNVSAIVVPGTMSRDFYVKMGAIPEKIFIAPNIVDNKMFIGKSSKFKEDKGKFKHELNINNDKVILYVGQLIKRKGVEYLINAFKKIKYKNDDICLIIIGDGVLKRELEEICVKKQIKDVHFTGWVSEEKKIIYYSIADLFVLPTLEDVWGLVINEAMCCGLPIISTNAAGCAVDMIIPGDNGFFVDAANADQLYLTMKKIILNEEVARKMGKISLEIIESEFNLDKMVNGFFSAIEYVKG
ncbi:MAG: glycosyltransferase family 4 protein [Candidatus Methanoperedenaceae archaeon]|nr:glycosyltransferase family 4 protein [Candidatus Methanoperedenaceae archaeon]